MTSIEFSSPSSSVVSASSIRVPTSWNCWRGRNGLRRVVWSSRFSSLVIAVSFALEVRYTILSRFWSLFSLYHVPQFHVSTVVPRSTLHHWSTPHRCHPTYTIHSHIQYQLSAILQFFLHTRCFPTATDLDTSSRDVTNGASTNVVFGGMRRGHIRIGSSRRYEHIRRSCSSTAAMFGWLEVVDVCEFW
jgi:hypothetical protein